MKICGLTKTTLLDYPQHLAATLFTPGCNFRCPFCHNSSLLEPTSQPPLLSDDFLMDFLHSRKDLLEGVCITGGEPTLQEDLPAFCELLHSMGYLVKLDTNGYRPEVLRMLLREKLVDTIAMDIKSSPRGYAISCGLPDCLLEPIEESIQLLITQAPDYEFRTTIVRELHDEITISEIGAWIRGAKIYYLQAFRDAQSVLLPGFHACSKQEMEHFRDILSADMSDVQIRGI
jgi:pyruvate formate lyase activating enzyme